MRGDMSTIPVIPILVTAIVGLLIIYARSLESKKKRYTYRELTPEEIIQKNTSANIYGKRSSGHLDIDKFIRKHSK
jgi:hypothetical protein